MAILLFCKITDIIIDQILCNYREKNMLIIVLAVSSEMLIEKKMTGTPFTNMV